MPIWWLSSRSAVLKLLTNGLWNAPGIRARHFADPGGGSSDLGLEAARNALEAAGVQPQDIDLIIVATSTPDMVFLFHGPASLQNKLGANGCPCF